MLKEFFSAIFGDLSEFKEPSKGFCQFVDPEHERRCTKDEGHDNPCSYLAPSDVFENQLVSVQWQTEDSANYVPSPGGGFIVTYNPDLPHE